VAVAAFLEGKIRFLDIAEVVEACLDAVPAATPRTVDDVLVADARARDEARRRIRGVMGAG
jgi:1-deoxy-D-xylulose-5-phosphate reductoisomerase